MSEVIYYKGLSCECDASMPRLTIEGCKVPVEIVNGLFHSTEPPDEKTKTLQELAEKVVDHSPELKSREAAKEEHLAILKMGVEQWNMWRRKQPEIRPMLYDANLSSGEIKLDLTCANFANAVLVNANLSGAILSGANFHEANLGGAGLSWANLTEANFCRTDLFRTNLFHADLTNANLQGTQLAGTNFEEIPFVPILEKGKRRYSMFTDLLENEWVLKPVVDFESTADLLLKLPDKIISPAEKRVETRQANLREIYG